MHPPAPAALLLRVVLACCAVALGAASTATAASITRFDVPTAGSAPTQLIDGPDGRLWFAESAKHEIGRIDPRTGQFAQIPTPVDPDEVSDRGVERIVRAANGMVWALDYGGNALLRVSPEGTVRARLGFASLSNPDEIVPAPGEGVFTLYNFGNPFLPGNTYNGTARIHDDLTNDPPVDQPYEDPHPGALGPDGNLWTVDYDYVTRFSNPTQKIPVGLGANRDVSSVAFGPDGSLWFTAYESGTWFTRPDNGVLGHVVGNQVQIAPLAPDAVPTSLRVGPDGALWWAETQGAIGRRDPATGAIQSGSLGPYKPAGIAFARDGGLWFTDSDANVVARVDGGLFPAPAPPPAPPAPPKPAPKPPTQKAAPKPTVASRSLRVAKRRVAVVVACPRTATATCRGTVRLRTTAKVKLPGRKKKAVATVSTAGSYAAKPGKRTTVKLRLSKAGRSVVRRGRTTKVSVQLTPKGQKRAVATRTVRLKG